MPVKEIYYIGIIDILTRFNGSKKVESFFRGLLHDRKTVSAVNPTLYGNRFMAFMKKAIKGFDATKEKTENANVAKMLNTSTPPMGRTVSSVNNN
jgi:Phosphatidylinositol-4-phosphate 5-Kinase